jgi:hypothetical protein
LLFLFQENVVVVAATDVVVITDVADVSAKEKAHAESPTSVLSDEVVDSHRSQLPGFDSSSKWK